MNLKLTLILILILSNLAVVFIAQNAAVVEIGFVFWRALLIRHGEVSIPFELNSRSLFTLRQVQCE